MASFATHKTLTFAQPQPSMVPQPPAYDPHQSYDPYYQQQEYDFVYGDRSINTLFISGLPDDIHAREIHNLFRRRHGFDNCQLKYTGRGNQVVAFATFFNHQAAVSAMHSLNGAKFDPETGSTLHIELARSNSRRKRAPDGGPYVVIDERTKSATNARETTGGDEGNGGGEPHETKKLDSGNKADETATEDGSKPETIQNTVETAVDPVNGVASVNEHAAEGSLPPCSTLFIANLGPNCTEDELKSIVSQYPGFKVLKLRARGGMPVAFADFEEINQAERVMNELQGSMLASSDRGGMHLEYARSKMRKP